MLGHKLEGVTLGRYAKRYEIKQLLNESVLKLDYGVNLTHLKNSRYVPK